MQRLIWITKKEAWNRIVTREIKTVKNFQIPWGRKRKYDSKRLSLKKRMLVM